MSLTSEQKKRYRSIGHGLKPIVTVAGNGLSESVIEEIQRALTDHELIKIKVAVADRDLRTQVIEEMCSTTKATLVQEIGKIALIFKSAKKPNPKLSNLIR